DQTLIFIANPGPDTQSDCLIVDGKNHLTPVWPPGETVGFSESLPITVPPYSVGIWDIAPKGAVR
ncbi:MAG TPA: hypothetical protein VIY86_11120, partial [Pirellulaceae bacterium]